MCIEPKNDSILNFNEIIDEIILDKNNNDPNNIIAHIIGKSYIFTLKNISDTFHEWIFYKNHKWEHIVNETIFFAKIFEKINRELRHYVSRFVLTHESIDKNCLTDKKKIINGLITTLKHHVNKKLVISKVSKLLHDPYVKETLDKDTNLICFSNGVYDFSMKKFRPGNPEDHISMSTGYNYIEYDFNNEHINDLVHFINTIQSTNQSDELMDILMNILSGKFTDKIFHLCGHNRSGISSFVKLLKHTLGDYMAVINSKKLLEEFVGHKIIDRRIVLFELESHIRLDEVFDTKIHTNIIIVSKHSDPNKLYPDPNKLYSDPHKLNYDMVIQFNNQFVDKPISPYQMLVDHKIIHSVSKWKKIFMATIIQRFLNKN
jgi:hypothetical protein